MLVATPIDCFELTNETLKTIQTTQTNETYNLLASFETDFEQLILNPEGDQRNDF